MPDEPGTPARRGATDERDVFAALASPVRRQILGMLLDGPRAVQDIAARFDMRRPSVSEHLKVLRVNGLVTENKHGRHRLYELRTEPLREVSAWLSPYERFWREKMTGLRDLLDSGDLPDD